MTMIKIFLAATVVGTMTLGGCTNPGENAKKGGWLGGATGSIAGALIAGPEKTAEGALIGALAGSAVGAGIGYSLDKQEADLRAAMDGNVGISNTGDRLIVTLPHDILFASDSSLVQPTLINDLHVVAENLKVHTDSTIQVLGHTDSDGDAEYNLKLSQERAVVIANILIGQGVSAARVQAIGRGEDQPVASNLTPEGKALNRRVEIVILPNAVSS